MTLSSLLSFIGGIGLFLLGMRLMTDGLKLAAGNALRDILARWTGSPLRGIVAGTLLTMLVQSSGPVIFATIGFVNAGLLSLTQAIGVIYGSSLGSTGTSWLVALIGVKVDLLQFALPTVGLGVLLRISGGSSRRTPIGDAITGLGIFFIGLNVLKSSFDPSSMHLPLDQFVDPGLWSLLLLILIGIVLATLMQSSGAALAVILTAVAGGIIPVDMGAGIVIGANVGSTSTSVIAMIGATADAKRAALAHVIYKVILAIGSLLLLSPLLWLVDKIGHGLGLDGSPAVLLAIFHTLINLIGVIAMRPLIEPLAAFLQGRFQEYAGDESKLQHLDHNVADTPVLALEALRLELARVGAIAQRVSVAALHEEHANQAIDKQDQQMVHVLMLAIGEFVILMQRRETTDDVTNALTIALQIGRYYDGMVDSAVIITQLQSEARPIANDALRAQLLLFRQEAERLLNLASPALDGGPGDSKQLLDAWDSEYKAMKALLLQAGSNGRLPISQMVVQLDKITAIRRMVQQAIKADANGRRLATAISAPATPTPAETDQEKSADTELADELPV
jgi:phosphate:Na+ symporter